MPIDIKNDSVEVALKKLQARENALRQLEKVSNLGSWEVDLKTNNSVWSSRSYEIYGYEPYSFKPTLQTFFKHLLPQYHQDAREKIENGLKSQKAVTFQGRSKRTDGKIIDILINTQIITDENGEPLKMIGTTQDITEYMSLKRSSQELLEIIERSSQEIYIIDKEFRYLYVNEGAVEKTGFSKEEFAKMNIFDINPYLTYNQAKEIAEGVDRKELTVNRTIHITKKGREYPVQTYLQTIVYNGEEGYLLFDSDISQLQRLEEELYYQAYHDSLTNLPNRSYFDERLEEEAAFANRNKTSFALLLIDLDRFKEINDTLGHQFGDKVLIETANKIKKTLRGVDMVARLGGDEFIVVLRDIKRAKNAQRVAQKIHNALRKPFALGEKEFFLSCSIGISLYPDDTREIVELVKFADTAMYDAKHKGRDRFCFYDKEMTLHAQKRIALEYDLRKAIENEGFDVYFQPQIDVRERKLVGVEALIRWKREDDEIVYPDAFIPFAQEIGLITQIDRIVMQKAIRYFMAWSQKGIEIPKISLNLATKQLLQEDFLDYILECSQKCNFDLSKLELELTESDLMHNPKRSIAMLKRLQEMGIKIAMDDFGTGYSSLAYLKKLPLHLIKIDRSFVFDLLKENENKEIVRAIVLLTKSLHFEIIAEGVETQEHEKVLESMGCHMMQGYRYAKPISAKEFEEFATSLIWREDESTRIG